jgi:hypothetical protein
MGRARDGGREEGAVTGVGVHGKFVNIGALEVAPVGRGHKVRKVQRLPQAQAESACCVCTSSMYPARVTVGHTAWVTTRVKWRATQKNRAPKVQPCFTCLYCYPQPRQQHAWCHRCA